MPVPVPLVLLPVSRRSSGGGVLVLVASSMCRMSKSARQVRSASMRTLVVGNREAGGRNRVRIVPPRAPGQPRPFSVEPLLELVRPSAFDNPGQERDLGESFLAAVVGPTMGAGRQAVARWLTTGLTVYQAMRLPSPSDYTRLACGRTGSITPRSRRWRMPVDPGDLIDPWTGEQLPPFLSTTQAGKLLGRHPNSVQADCQRGVIPSLPHVSGAPYNFGCQAAYSRVKLRSDQPLSAL